MFAYGFAFVAARTGQDPHRKSEKSLGTNVVSVNVVPTVTCAGGARRVGVMLHFESVGPHAEYKNVIGFPTTVFPESCIISA